MAAETFTCRSCGAPADPQVSACGHCGAPFLLIPCEGCGQPVVFGAASCPKCHAPGPSRLPLQATRQPCPACDAYLMRSPFPPAGMLACSACGGAWLEPDAFMGMCMDAAAAGKGRPAEPAPTARGAALVPGFYRRCPSCTLTMNRQQFGQRSGVVLDVCREHGVWLDAGEWPRLVAFLSDGGGSAEGFDLPSYLKQNFGWMPVRNWTNSAARMDAEAAAEALPPIPPAPFLAASLLLSAIELLRKT